MPRALGTLWPCLLVVLLPMWLLQGCGGGGGPSPSPPGPGPSPGPPGPPPLPPLRACGQGYNNVDPCPSGQRGDPQTDWKPVAKMDCKGPCDGYSTWQWTADTTSVTDAIKARNNGSLVSPSNSIPKTIDELRCWFLPQYSWGMQRELTSSPAPPWNPQPEAAYIDDAGNSLGGGLPGPNASVACCCQEECTMEMIELRHWIFQPPGCKAAEINYALDHNPGRVLLTRASDRSGKLTNLKHESCMCGKKSTQEQPPFYYYVVQGPSNPHATDASLLSWLNSLRTAYNNLFDIWAQRPPCSGECLIMGGASDAWVTYGKSTARSVMVQLRAFAAFNPHALPNACGSKGVMLRFGGMTLLKNTVLCTGKDKWGATGAVCPTQDDLDPATFYQSVTQQDDGNFLKDLQRFGAHAKMTLETDSALATITMNGVTITPKTTSCSAPQPTLNMDWRCKANGGVADEASCLPASKSDADVVVAV